MSSFHEKAALQNFKKIGYIWIEGKKWLALISDKVHYIGCWQILARGSARKTGELPGSPRLF